MTSRSPTRSPGDVLISGLTASSATGPRWRFPPRRRWRAASARAVSVVVVVSRSAMSTLPDQEDDEHGGADDPEDEGDRYLEGHDDRSSDDVADGDDRSEERR